MSSLDDCRSNTGNIEMSSVDDHGNNRWKYMLINLTSSVICQPQLLKRRSYSNQLNDLNCIACLQRADCFGLCYVIALLCSAEQHLISYLVSPIQTYWELEQGMEYRIKQVFSSWCWSLGEGKN